MPSEYTSLRRQYPILQFAQGLAEFWVICMFISAQQLQSILSQDGNESLSIPQHSLIVQWKISLDIMQSIASAESYYFLQQTKLPSRQVVLSLVMKYVLDALELSVIYLVLKAVKLEQNECNYRQGILQILSVFPGSKCAWQVTCLHSVGLFVHLLSAFYYIFQENTHFSAGKIILAFFAVYYIGVALISLKSSSASDFFAIEASKQLSPGFSIISFFQGIAFVNIWLPWYEKQVADSKNQQVNTKKQQIRVCSITILCTILIIALLAVVFPRINALTLKIANTRLMYLLLIAEKYLMNFATLFIIAVLLSNQSIIVNSVCSNGLLEEIGSNAQQINSAYALIGTFYQNVLRGIEIGPADNVIRCLLSAGIFILVLSYSFVVILMRRIIQHIMVQIMKLMNVRANLFINYRK